MKIAVAQIACALGEVETNIAKMRASATKAREQGAELIVFPEMADTGYSMPIIREKATAWTTGAVPALREMAKELSLAVVSGVSERVDEAIYNTQIVIDASGEILGRYRKAHLFAGGTNDESKCFKPGNELVDVSLGEFRFGLTICYDLRFPEIFRALAVEQQTNVFLVSAAWPFPRLEHFRALAMARAIENQSYLIASNRVGVDDGATCCGSSVIIDPYGVVMAAASADREELIQAEISVDVLNAVRERMKVFAHRRVDLYEKRR